MLTNDKTSTIPVFLVNGVYFPTQKLRFKMSDSQNRSYIEKNGTFGIVSKRLDGEFVKSKDDTLTQFENHYSIGVLVKIIEEQTLMSNRIQSYTEFMVEVVGRFKIKKILVSDENQVVKLCEVDEIDDEKQYKKLKYDEKRNSLVQETKDQGLKMIELLSNREEPRLLMNQAMKINSSLKDHENPVKMLFLIASVIRFQSRQTKQELLEIKDFDERLQKLYNILKEDILKGQEIKSKAAQIMNLDKDQRRTAIRSMFGRKPQQQTKGEDELNEVQQLAAKLDACQLPDETQKLVTQELKKLKNLDTRDKEYHVGLNYLGTIASLPWSISQEENSNPRNAKIILDRDHFGLEQVKKRIVQFLAVRTLKNKTSGSILCLHGPPGVGKTSLGKSIAEAMNRKFYKISLGGINDEPEIRGHRRTYVGSMPGVIIQSLQKIKTNNPVFLLDEIDKLGSGRNNGDPGAALLEVLDPAQNDQFTDHFLGTPFDLSNVVFIATANQLESIHPALQDRMEIIDISGYSIEEKLQIANRYLIPKQIIENGLRPEIIRFKSKEVMKIIMEYTAESGVRNLERAVGSVCRSVAYEYAICDDIAKFKPVIITPKLVEEALGNQKYDHHLSEQITSPGVAIGLAYTSIGGACLLVETTKYPGSGQLKLTGKLGEVMKESVGTSISWIQANAGRIGILDSHNNKVSVVEEEQSLQNERRIMHETFRQMDLHVHFPAAATPKDGPSAGVTITVALVSLFTGRRVKSDFAMTGEISLKGLALPVGGIKEKCIAAHRNGIKNVIIPRKNKKDSKDIPMDIRKQLTLHFADHVSEYLELALEKKVDHEYMQQNALNYGAPFEIIKGKM